MISKCLELTQKVVPTVNDVTPKPEHGKILEIDVKNRMIGDGNLFAVKSRKFHQRIADTRGYFEQSDKARVVAAMEVRCGWRPTSQDLKGLTGYTSELSGTRPAVYV
jgi:hypothetical protein